MAPVLLIFERVSVLRETGEIQLIVSFAHSSCWFEWGVRERSCMLKFGAQFKCGVPVRMKLNRFLCLRMVRADWPTNSAVNIQ